MTPMTEVREAILRLLAEIKENARPVPFRPARLDFNKLGLTVEQQRELRRRLACRL